CASLGNSVIISVRLCVSFSFNSRPRPLSIHVSCVSRVCRRRAASAGNPIDASVVTVCIARSGLAMEPSHEDSLYAAGGMVLVTQKPAPDATPRRPVGSSMEEMMDAIEAFDADDDEIDRHDVVEQARQDENQDAGDQRDQRRNIRIGEGHGVRLRAGMWGRGAV